MIIYKPSKLIQTAIQNELKSTMQMGAIAQVMAVVGLLFFLPEKFVNDFVNLSCLYSLIVLNCLRLGHYYYTIKSQQAWLNWFATISLASSVCWATFFASMAYGSRTDPLLLPFVFLGPISLVATSYLRMFVSKLNSVFFQLPLVVCLVASFAIIYPDSTGMYLGIFFISVFYALSYKAQNKLNTTWVNLQMYSNELQSVIDSIPGGLSVIKNNNYIKVNSYVLQTLQVDNKDFINRPVGSFYPESEFTQSLQSFIKSNLQRTQQEFVMPTFAGLRTHYVLFRRLRMEDQDEQIIISSFDIEDLKQAQHDLEKQRAKLEHSSKMASLGEMSSGLAHEINNPLAVISARAQILQVEIYAEKFDKARMLKSVDTVIAMTLRISKIIKSLKLFARDSSFDTFTTANLSDIVDETVSLCEVRSAKFATQISKLETGQRYDLECLPTQVSQVILNAFNNSFDATANLSERWITIKLSDEGSDVRIEIVDSGRGIAQDIQEKIMMPFFTTKEAGSGTGLGLSLSKGIVESHNGQIFFDHTSVNTKLIIIFPKFQIGKVKPTVNDAA